MSTRLTAAAPWISAAGTVVLLVGLAWDVVLHALDPLLATRESVFTLGNPGHVLLGAGIALTVAGTTLHLLGRGLAWHGRSEGRAALSLGAAVAIAGLAGATFGAAATGGGLMGEHAHGARGAEVGAGAADHSGQSQEAGTAGHAHAPANQTLVSAGSGASSAGEMGAGHGQGHGHAAGPAVSTEQLLAAARLVEQVRASAKRFEDIGAARAEGYSQSTPERRGFAHYHNQRYAADGRILDPERPETLVYYRGLDGQLSLAGAMFLMPQGQKGPQIGGPLTVWHSHEALCYAGTRLAARATADGKCPAGSVLRDAPEMMHVWLMENPAGVFGDDMEPTAMAPQPGGPAVLAPAAGAAPQRAPGASAAATPRATPAASGSSALSGQDAVRAQRASAMREALVAQGPAAIATFQAGRASG